MKLVELQDVLNKKIKVFEGEKNINIGREYHDIITSVVAQELEKYNLVYSTWEVLNKETNVVLMKLELDVKENRKFRFEKVGEIIENAFVLDKNVEILAEIDMSEIVNEFDLISKRNLYNSYVEERERKLAELDELDKKMVEVAKSINKLENK